MNDTADFIESSRSGIQTYTDGFSGDIGQKFKRVDARLERAQDALEADEDVETVQEILQTAQNDLQRVIRNCFTGMSPGNLSEYVEEPVTNAVESLDD